MATRRRKKSWLMQLILGKPAPKRRSSSGRRKTGSNPTNVVRRYQRWAATVDTNRATSLKERNDLREKRAKALLARDKEKARAKADKERRRVAADKAKKARIQAAQARRMQQTQPTVRTVPAQPVVTQRRATPTEVSASLCNAPCDDGTPCQNSTKGGPCSAGHNPNAKPRAHMTTTNRRRGETREQFVQRGRSEAVWAATAGRQKAAAGGGEGWWRRP